MKNVISFLIAVVAIMGLAIASPSFAETVDGVSDDPQPVSQPGNINFEPPILFMDTLPLMLEQNPQTNAYFVMGDGAVLDVCTFSVTGYSGPNALAWNCRANNYDSSVPALPEVIQFINPVSNFSCIVASNTDAGQTAGIAALDGSFNVIDTDYVTLTAAMQPLSVSGRIIKYLYVVGPCVMVMDNLLFN